MYNDVKEEIDEAILTLKMIRGNSGSEKNLEFFANEVAIRTKYKKKFTIFTVGNGGSAATASHFVCDLTKLVREKTGEGIKAVCLNDNMALVSAIANDRGNQYIYVDQLREAGPGDILVIFTTSGGSENGQSYNLVSAARSVKCEGEGVMVIAFSGKDGGALRDYVDIEIRVPHWDTPLIEGIHSVLAHAFINSLIGKLKNE